MDRESFPPRRVSIRDLAKILGVSHATVSLVLRDNPRISRQVREKVRKAAEEYGYQPDPMLSALSHYRKEKRNNPISASIAWVNAWEDPEQLRDYKEFDHYWVGAAQAARKYGYRLEEFRLGREISPERLHQILSTRGIRGVLLPPQRPHPDWKHFPWHHYAVVRLGWSLQTPACHVVSSDQVANTLLAFRKIRGLGYQRIGFVINEAEVFRSGHLFEAGFLLAQRSVDAAQRVPVCVIGGTPDTDRCRQVAQWINDHKVDAILTDSPTLPKLLNRAGIRTPQDVGIAVTTVLDLSVPAGIDQHPEEIGRVAFLMLNSLINDGAFGIPPILRHIVVAGTWIDGDSMPPRRA